MIEILNAIEKLLSLFILNDFNIGNSLNLNFFTINNINIGLSIQIKTLTILTISIIAIIAIYYFIDLIIILFRKFIKKV